MSENDENDFDEPNLKPIYRFKWEGQDRENKRTDELENELSFVQVEVLAKIGKEDSECNVEIVGYKN